MFFTGDVVKFLSSVRIHPELQQQFYWSNEDFSNRLTKAKPEIHTFQDVKAASHSANFRACKYAIKDTDDVLPAKDARIGSAVC